MAKTEIEWAQETWNPLGGCSEISPGCTNCYAAVMAHRLTAMGQRKYMGTTKKLANGKVTWTGKISLDESALTIPLKNKKPTVYFVNSMSDLFHEDVPDEYIDKVFAVMALCPQHTFQVLTKRAERLQSFIAGHAPVDDGTFGFRHHNGRNHQDGRPFEVFGVAAYWPLKNVWLGVSVENRKHGLPRIAHLKQTQAAIRFLSVEPLLEDLGDLTPYLLNTSHGDCSGCTDPRSEGTHQMQTRQHPERGIGWIVCGAESGHKRRPMQQEWAESIASQCKQANVAFFMKQMLIDGKVSGDIDKFPESLRVREFPKASVTT